MKLQNFSTQNLVLLCLLLVTIIGCSKSETGNSNNSTVGITPTDDDPSETVTFADIDFSNWKITLPVDENNNTSPDEYQPDQLTDFGYQTLEPVVPYMYDDPEDASIIFHTFPDQSTANSSYSRTELRELINPNNSRENWTLVEGGEMTGRLKVSSISENNESSDDYHKVIVMQIHGIISEEDMAIHNFSSNNGPPLIKIYWKDGYVWSHKKSLIDENTSGDDLLETSSNTWYDIKQNLGYVGFEVFDFKITATNAKLELQLNDEDPFIYQDISLDKWPYENYFKAGNYLNSTHPDAFSYIKYYNLRITH